MIHFEFDESIICPDDITATPERIEQYKDYYCVKYMIAKLCQPKAICEIGVRCGYSAWSFLQACPDAKYIGIDANNGTHGGQGGQSGVYKDWAIKLLKDYDFDYIEMDTQVVNKLPINDSVDFMHVDGDHTINGVMHDMLLGINCIGHGNGYMLIDDIDYIQNVGSGVSATCKCHNLKVVTLPSLRGEALIQI